MDKKFIEIIENTWKLYTKYGIKSITMDDIAAENGISKKTLYKYVSDKTELIRQTMKYEFGLFGENLTKIMNKGLNAIDEIFDMIPIFSEIINNISPSIEFDLRKYYTALFREVEAIQIEHIYNLVEKNLSKGKKQGIYRYELDIKLVSKIMVLIHTSKVEHELVSYKEFFDDKVFNKSLIYHLRAVCNTKGFSILEKKINEINKK